MEQPGQPQPRPLHCFLKRRIPPAASGPAHVASLPFPPDVLKPCLASVGGPWYLVVTRWTPCLTGWSGDFHLVRMTDGSMDDMRILEVELACMPAATAEGDSLLETHTHTYTHTTHTHTHTHTHNTCTHTHTHTTHTHNTHTHTHTQHTHTQTQSVVFCLQETMDTQLSFILTRMLLCVCWVLLLLPPV